jgi:hypothetical protein
MILLKPIWIQFGILILNSFHICNVFGFETDNSDILILFIWQK